MDLPVEPVEAQLATFRPKTGTLEEWNAAYLRAEDYLRAHRLHNRLHQSRLIQVILERAARRHADNPDLDPTTFVVEETELLMDQWFGDMLDIKNISHDHIAVAGRVALLLCDGSEKWPYAFLDSQVAPSEFIAAMRTSSMKAGPDMAVSSMVPRDIDLGTITEAAGETFETIEKWPLLRTAVLWAVFLGALLAIFYATR